MGLRFRKSINLGGIRINISKSGIGYSFGIPGMRYTKKAKGGTRTSLSIPGTGFSYVKDSGKAVKKSKPTSKEENNNNTDGEVYSKIISSSSHQLIDKMNEATKKNQSLLVTRILLCVAFLYGFAFFIASISFFIASIYGRFSIESADGTFDIVLSIVDRIAMGVISAIAMIGAVFALKFTPESALIELNYNFENTENETNYCKMLAAIKDIENYEYVWELSTLNIHNWKNHAGASASVRRKNLKIDECKFFKSDYDIKSLNMQDKKIIFLPDIIAIQQGGEWMAVEWQQFQLELNTIVFMESEKVPNDAIIIGYTYKHPNKDGSPDKRYADNPQIAKCQYSVMNLKSENGLDVVIMVANQSIAKMFYDTFNGFKS